MPSDALPTSLTQEGRSQKDAVKNDVMERYLHWRDVEGGNDGSWITFLNMDSANMKGAIDREIDRRKSGHLGLGGVLLQGDFQRSGDGYTMRVERYVKTGDTNQQQPWTQGAYPETIHFTAEEVLASSTKHSGLWLSMKREQN